MTITVTLDLYSGLPNPTWELSANDAAALRALMAARPKTARARPPAALGHLGYRGLIVSHAVQQGGLSVMRAFDGLVAEAGLDVPNVVDQDSEIELFLLNTAGSALRDSERDHAREQIEKNARGAPGDAEGMLEPLVEPSWNPAKWNSDPAIRQSNNCYNYANDKITNTFAQPGRGSGATGALSCPGISEGAVRDGLIRLPSPDVTPADGQVVALVIAPGMDYHWYRRDDNGRWSHKPGQTPAINHDNAGQLITDPRTCNRGPYSEFCGFFNAIPAKTTIR